MKTITCEFCAKPNEEDRTICKTCGAPLQIKALPKTQEHKGEPFYLKGFMIWPSRAEGFFNDSIIYYIWLGDRLIGEFTITHEMCEVFRADYGEGVSMEPLLEKMLDAAIGNDVVIKYKTRNKRRPLIYEVRVTETPELIEARQLIRQIMQGEGKE